MLRFLPDDWLEGLLRPFLLADPVAGLYFEAAAPDWRYAWLIVFLLTAWVGRRGHLALTRSQQGALLSLLVMFYVWTFAIGNARYFVAGLLLVGPLLLVAWRLLPGTLAFRSLALVAVIGLQYYTLQLHYTANTWGLLPWRQGPGLSVEASSLRERPAVFLSITGISYSILVPRFHPQSRWANMAGQRDITPALPEYPRLRELLASPLPKYVVVPLNPKYLSATLQPEGAMQDFLVRSLAVQGLALTGGACTVLRSGLSVGVEGSPGDIVPKQGFWFCPVLNSALSAARVMRDDAKARELRDVFERVEGRCPRFFPPGDGSESHADGIAARHYRASDSRLYIDGDNRVLYKYFRSMNPTLIGTVADVRQDRFTIACEKLPGRYQLPWRRD